MNDEFYTRRNRLPPETQKSFTMKYFLTTVFITGFLFLLFSVYNVTLNPRGWEPVVRGLFIGCTILFNFVALMVLKMSSDVSRWQREEREEQNMYDHPSGKGY